jgi:hypothetical protein
MEMEVPSKLLSMEKDLKKSPWNYKIWGNLISDVLSAADSLDPAYVRKVFDKLLEFYPTIVSTCL